VPRAGLDPAAVVAAGAALADEIGFANLTMGLLAERVGVRTPSLYKHVGGQGDLNRRIATLTTNEAADAVGAAIQGYAGRDALAAAAKAIRGFALTHPGRYTATTGAEATGPDDPLAQAVTRLIGALSAVLRGYRVEPGDMDHALRMLRSFLHGFVTVQAANGFRWAADIDESFDWLIEFVDRGLRPARTSPEPSTIGSW
jgi:AcrR family transcriptional regulator